MELSSRFAVGSEYSEVKQQQTPTSFSWTHVDEDEYETQVHLIKRGDYVRIRLSQYIAYTRPEIQSAGWGALGALIFGPMMSQSFAIGAFTSLLMYVVAFALTFAATYGYDLYWRRSRQEELEELADIISMYVAEPAGAQAEVKQRDTEKRPKIEVEDPREDAVGEHRAQRRSERSS